MEAKKQTKKASPKKKTPAKKAASPKKAAPKKASGVKKSAAKRKAAPKRSATKKAAPKKPAEKPVKKAAVIKKTAVRKPEPLAGTIDPLREYIRNALNPAPEAASGKKTGPLSNIFKKTNIIIAVVTVLVIASLAGIALLKVRQARMEKADYESLYKDGALTIIEGENVISTNAPYWLAEKDRCFGGRYLSMYARNLPPQRYLAFKYKFDVQNSGVYKIFLAGSAPGSRSEGDNISLSPYKVRVDYTRMNDIYEETHDAMLIGKTGSDFYSSYEYAPGMRITKVGELYLARGEHEIEFRVYRKPLEGDKYAFYADAVFIVPNGWKSSRKFCYFPEDIFSY